MTAWNATQYLRFENERTRAATDLVARIDLTAPSRVVDLGCGAGNSTAILRQRWPHAAVTGIDDSPEMIQAAQESSAESDWLLADIGHWMPQQAPHLVYANAALHWLPDHAQLVPRLFGFVAVGGVLAFQIPSHAWPAVRQIVHDVSRRPEWDQRMHVARRALTMHSPQFYYDLLATGATSIDIWETEYFHVMPSVDAIIDWIASTGLRPFLAALADDRERTEFLSQVRQQANDTYEIRSNGKVLHPFRRTFVIACH